MSAAVQRDTHSCREVEVKLRYLCIQLGSCVHERGGGGGGGGGGRWKRGGKGVGGKGRGEKREGVEGV